MPQAVLLSVVGNTKAGIPGSKEELAASPSYLSAYLVIGALLEERRLVAEFGDAYRRYQEKVSIGFPLKWLSRTMPSS